MVREDGIIVGSSADAAWAVDALGVDPTKIIHQSMAHYVDVFADVTRAVPVGRVTPTLVTGTLHSNSQLVLVACYYWVWLASQLARSA